MYASGGNNASPENQEQKEIDDELKEFESKNVLILAGKFAQKTQLWTFLLVAFCAMRAANPFTVGLAYLSLVARAV